MCGLCPSGWMFTIVLCIYTCINVLHEQVHACASICVHDPRSCSLLSEVLNAFAKHDYIFLLQHYADDSACAANAKDITMFHLFSCRFGFGKKKLFLQSFSALYSHFCWNHFSFGFLLRTSPYVTFVVFVVIFIYIIVKYSLYSGILLHLGFVLLRAYHTEKKIPPKRGACGYYHCHCRCR